MLVVGVVMFFAVTEEIMATSTVGQQLLNAGNGEWKTAKLNITDGGEITLISTSPSIALIPASDISNVTSGNLASYAIKPTNGGTNTSAGTISVYMPPSGSYYIVAFSSSSPTVTYSVVNSASLTVLFGLLEISAIVMGIAGLIVLIIGVVLKPKHREGDDPLNLYSR